MSTTPFGPWFRILATLALAFVAGGCNVCMSMFEECPGTKGDGPPCVSDSECGSENVCAPVPGIDNKCVSMCLVGCHTDEQCQAGKRCSGPPPAAVCNNPAVPFASSCAWDVPDAGP